MSSSSKQQQTASTGQKGVQKRMASDDPLFPWNKVHSINIMAHTGAHYMLSAGVLMAHLNSCPLPLWGRFLTLLI